VSTCYHNFAAAYVPKGYYYDAEKGRYFRINTSDPSLFATPSLNRIEASSPKVQSPLRYHARLRMYLERAGGEDFYLAEHCFIPLLQRDTWAAAFCCLCVQASVRLFFFSLSLLLSSPASSSATEESLFQECDSSRGQAPADRTGLDKR
jgi:hypothetical protein